MGQKDESPAQGQGQSHGCDKGNTFPRIKTTIKALFSRGERLTVKEINNRTGGNDARKHISELRREGWHIVDLRLSGGRKLYWLAKDILQDDSHEGGVTTSNPSDV